LPQLRFYGSEACTLRTQFLLLLSLHSVGQILYTGGPKSKPLPNYQNIVLHRIKVCQWD